MKHIPRLYIAAELKVDSSLVLPAANAHHILRVLRLTKDAEVILFNGNGHDYTARITEADKRHCSVTLVQAHEAHRESPLRIHLAQGISRNDRMDWVIQKAVELGVTEITPLLCHKGMIKLTEERLEKKHMHWQNIVISACEQSGRNIIPKLHPVQTLKQWIDTYQGQNNWMLDPMATDSFKALPSELPNCTILIGPESGFSPEELTQAQQKFTGLQMGPRILRTETAPLAMISALQARYGDW